jgi:hypothetical protein
MSNETRFTPGPWFVTNRRDIFTGLAAPNTTGEFSAHNDGWHIAEALQNETGIGDGLYHCMSNTETEANAALMAASPDLYAALENTIKLAHDAIENMTDKEEAILITAQAALAKARGEA